jgi:DNA-binding transcriptional MerR regulator
MFPDKAITQVTQIQRMIATGFTIEDIRGFPDCMLLIEGARSCDQIGEVQRERLKAIERQIADLEKRRARLIKMLTDGAAPPVE